MGMAKILNHLQMKDLTLYEFNIFNEEKQYYLIFNAGIFLDEHQENDKRFALYALYKFFIEVEYDITKNMIINKVSFVFGEKLDRYSKFKFD